MYFFDLIEHSKKLLKGDEEFICSFNGENSDFVRLNHAKIRQAGNVLQNSISFELIQGKRHLGTNLNLSGDLKTDISTLEENINIIREHIKQIPDDPYFNYCEEISQTKQEQKSELPDSQDILQQIHSNCHNIDLVGILAVGTISRGFASSLGHQHWFESNNFNFDWSCYLRDDKAVKSSYAGFKWQEQQFLNKIEACKQQLPLLDKQPLVLKPGKYRSYLSPAALHELMSLLSWGSFGIKSHRSLQTPLLKMIKEDKKLDPRINLCENNNDSVGPQFTRTGFIKPSQIELIKSGKYKHTLVSPRSAKEFNMAVNAGSEFPEALQLEGGNLDSNILNHLQDGLLINNLWYCNYSDRNNCRITGMTRFACFWVENGNIKAPVDVMRFDDSIYNILGSNLIDLSEEREFIFDNNTYNERSTDSCLLPGILVNDFKLTL